MNLPEATLLFLAICIAGLGVATYARSQLRESHRVTAGVLALVAGLLLVLGIGGLGLTAWFATWGPEDIF